MMTSIYIGSVIGYISVLIQSLVLKIEMWFSPMNEQVKDMFHPIFDNVVHI